MSAILDQFKQMRVVPVVAIENAQDAMKLADALIEGGLPCAEITFRTAAAVDAMGIMARRGDILVGAGTVLTVDQVKAAVDVGARFMVSPGFNSKVVGYCVENNITVTPGICTPSDIEAALGFGLEVLKFFPAEAFGGLKTLKAMSGPYGAIKFIPTGGISPGNLVEYLQFPKTLACGGTWIAKSNLISGGHFDQILSSARAAVELVKKAGQST
jgi:2-dehydro-3-deoxyphosphogluconate aldolase/(4S)-4-hydroxy-2-oxoglutarate aldolase